MKHYHECEYCGEVIRGDDNECEWCSKPESTMQGIKDEFITWLTVEEILSHPAANRIWLKLIELIARYEEENK